MPDSKKSVEPQKSSIGTNVKIINKHPIDGKYIVESETGEFYLIPTEQLEYSYNIQKFKILASTEKPYEFESELVGAGINKALSRKALYQAGIVSKPLSRDDDRLNLAISNRGIPLKRKNKDGNT